MKKKEVEHIADVEAHKEVRKHEKGPYHEGKTKKMKKGGPTSDELRTHGRNVARAMNQRGGARGR